MSRHFNYELDERRIKLLLKNNSMPYKEDVWSEYVQKTKPLTKVNKIPSIKTTVPFAINKGMVLTASFLILIFSFTFVIAKFVDFSGTTKSEKGNRALVPEADNFKSTQLEKALEPKKEEKPVVAVVTIDSSAIKAATTQTMATATPTINTNNYTAANTNTSNSVANQNNNTRVVVDTTNKSKSKSDSTAVGTTKNFNKKKKKTVETLETKPLTTELTTPTEEPELELR
ncbi:MAG: hypothetical protein JNM96_06980 [Bacteroidia bacterium]|nr:hypothetical protein [Bacteroidia bacterium]